MTLPKVFTSGKPATKDASTVLRHAHATASSMLAAFDRRSGAGKVGRPKDVDQDLLRAMVVFAGAGLDSALKQLIRDALPALIDQGDPDARKAFERFAENRLSDNRAIARLLISDSPRQGVIDQLVEERTAGSLQSWEELTKVAGYFGVVEQIPIKADLKPAFDCRNLIVHELDVDIDGPAPGNRKPRSKDEMVSHASGLLKTASEIVKAVDAKLT